MATSTLTLAGLSRLLPRIDLLGALKERTIIRASKETFGAICLIAALIDHRTTRRHTMSTKARKQRKRAGIPFTKPVKTPTPFTRHEGKLQPRSENDLRTKFEARDLTYPEGGAA